MTLTKADLADLLFERVGLNKREAKDMVECQHYFVERIEERLARLFPRPLPSNWEAVETRYLKVRAQKKKDVGSEYFAQKLSRKLIRASLDGLFYSTQVRYLSDSIDGKPWKITGNQADPNCNGRLCPRGTGGLGAYLDEDRLKTPLIRTDVRGKQQFREATWDEAFDTMIDGAVDQINPAQHVLPQI